MRLRKVWILAAAIALGMSACGTPEVGLGNHPSDGSGGREWLTVYSSLPYHGAAGAHALAAVNGAKLALEQVGAVAGKFAIKLKSFDDSTAEQGDWEPSVTSANALRAAADKATIGYIGDLDSGATEVSLPILNEAGIAQVSPGSTAVGITSDGPGAAAGEPDKYYPSGKRTYARLLPSDAHEGAALAALARERGCNSAYILNDQERYGAGLAHDVEIAARKVGLEIKGDDGIDKRATDYHSLGAKIARTAAQCFIYSGVAANNAVRLFKDMAVALPNTPLLGPAGIEDSRFFDPKDGGLPPDVAKRVLITIPGVAPEEYPPAGQEFLSAFASKYGEENPDRYAAYGYESMRLLLDAIKRAGDEGNDRTPVVDHVMSTKHRQAVFGTYSIGKNGDITPAHYGVYKISNGAMVFDHMARTKT